MSDVQPPAPLVVGDTWYQQLFSYGISRAVDAEFLRPFYPGTSDTQYGVDDNGTMYTRGQPSLIGGINPVVLLVLGSALLYVILKD